MAYDVEKDQVHKEWMIGDGLLVQIARYNGGPWKIRTSVRMVPKADGTTRPGKAGGMSLAEVEALAALVPQIKKSFPKPEKTKGK